MRHSFSIKKTATSFLRRMAENAVLITLFLNLTEPRGSLSARPDPDSAGTADRRAVYVIHESWHTGLILTMQDIPKSLLALLDDVRDYPYVEFGWGDEEFFQSSDPGVWTAVRAVAWPTPSVMHVYGFHTEPKNRSGAKSVYSISLRRSDFEKLCGYIHESFALDSLQKPQRTSFYGNTFFYKANGDYHFFNMCNHWTARALEQAGCPVSSPGAFTAESVIDRVRKFGTRVRPSK